MKRIFYELDRIREAPESYRAWWSDEDIETHPIYCPENPGHQRSSGRLNDLTVILQTPKVLKLDFIWTWYGEPMVNERVINILKTEGFIGWDIRPVTIKKVKRFKGDTSSIPKYWELKVTGKGGKTHPDSGLYVAEECKACDSKRYSAYDNGIIVDEKNWDGSDFFSVTEYPGMRLVTEQVKESFEKNKITNVIFTPSHELRWPETVPKP